MDVGTYSFYLLLRSQHINVACNGLAIHPSTLPSDSLASSPKRSARFRFASGLVPAAGFGKFVEYQTRNVAEGIAAAFPASERDRTIDRLVLHADDSMRTSDYQPAVAHRAGCWPDYPAPQASPTLCKLRCKHQESAGADCGLCATANNLHTLHWNIFRRGSEAWKASIQLDRGNARDGGKNQTGTVTS